jgi:endonuclease III
VYQKEYIGPLFYALEHSNAIPSVELEYVNNFTLLVAIILSARATDVGVNKATKSLFQVCTSPEQMVLLGIDELKNYVKTIGLYITKAKNIIAMSNILIEKYNSNVPGEFEALVSLPGVGRKTANVFLNTVFGADTIPVDTHVFRVSRRLGLAKSNSVLGVEKELLAQIPKQYLSRVSNWFVLHGRYICKARKPLCNQCIIRDYCEYYKQNF